MTKVNEFTPKDNPAFILHGKLSTSYETVSSVIATTLTCQLPVPEIGPDEVLVEVKETVGLASAIA